MERQIAWEVTFAIQIIVSFEEKDADGIKLLLSDILSWIMILSTIV